MIGVGQEDVMTRSALALAAIAISGCGGGRSSTIESCTEQPLINVSDVGEVKALAQFKDGYVVAGLRFNTMRVATIEADGTVTPASAIGTLSDIVVTSVPFHAGLYVEGPVWTAVFPEEDALIGYSVDTVGGDAQTHVYQNHFTNSEPYVLWMPTAFYFGPTPGIDTQIAMQRVEIAGDVETAAPHIWYLQDNGVARVEEVHPGESSAPPITVIDGVGRRALSLDGYYDYSQLGPPLLLAPLPAGITVLGAGAVGEGELTATAATGDGSAHFLHVYTDGAMLDSATAMGTPLAVGLVSVAPGVVGWLAPDASLHWRSFGGESEGPATPLTGLTTATAPGPNVVRSGNDFAFAVTDGTSWYVARQTCQ
jgi:hypothetical protein